MVTDAGAVRRRVLVPLVVAALIVVAGLSMDRVYNGHLLVELVSGAALGSVVVSVALRRVPAWLVAPVSVLAMVGYALFAVNLSARAGGVSGDLRTLTVDAARNAVPRLLTALIPVEPQPDTVLAPVILAWLAGFAGAEIASRTRRSALALVPPTLLYVGALVLVGPNARPVIGEPLAFAGLAAVGLVAGAAVAGPRSLPGMASGQRAALRLRTFSGLAVGLVAVLAIVAVVAPLVARAVHHSPTDPRRYVAPPTLDTLDQNPLIRISGWAADPGQKLFKVRILKSGRTEPPTPTPVPSAAPTTAKASTGVIQADNTPDPVPTEDTEASGGAYDTRLRLAVLTDWDGVTWHVDADYRSAGRVLPPVVPAPGLGAPDPEAPPPLTIQESITVGDLEGRLMPAVSAPSRVDGVRVAFDQSSGTLLQNDPLAPGVTYTVTSTNPSVNVTILPAADVPSGAAVARYLRVGDTVPSDVTQLATKLASQEGSPYLRALGLESFLKEHYRYAPDAPSGHAYPNLRFFLFEDPRAGGQRGTSEQFATAYATLGRLMGLPTRVVVGFRTPSGGGEITGADALAWPEVLFSGVGWVAFNPIPESDTPPRPLEDEFLPKPTPPPSPPDSVEPPSPPTGSAPPAIALTGKSDVDGPGVGLIAGSVGGGVLLLISAFLVVIMVLRLRRQRYRLRRGSPPERVLGAWDEVLDTLVLAGAPPPEHLAAAEVASHAQQVAGTVPGRRHTRRPRPAAPGLDELAGQVNEVGFAGELASTDEVTAFAAVAQARAFERALRSGLPWWRRLLWRVDPRPLRRRR